MNKPQINTLKKLVGVEGLQLYSLLVFPSGQEITIPSIYIQHNHNWINITPEIDSFDGTYVEWTFIEICEFDPPKEGKFIAVELEGEISDYPLIPINTPAHCIVKSLEIYSFVETHPEKTDKSIEYDGCLVFNCDGESRFAVSSYEAVTGTLDFVTDKVEIERLISMSTQKVVIV